MKKYIIIATIIFFPSVVYLFFSTGSVNFIHLPYYGPRDPIKTIVNGKEHTDTVYHAVPAFSFTNYDGRVISDKTFAGKIYVANFFFTTCKTICPKMTSGMKRIEERFKSYPKLLFLSHTVNPQLDTLNALRAFANYYQADSSRWFFVRGDKKAIYDIGINGYLLPVGDDAKAEGGVLHSEMLVLVDKEKHIRGFYDGTSPAAMETMVDDIKTLIAEYEKHNKSRNKITQGK